MPVSYFSIVLLWRGSAFDFLIVLQTLHSFMNVRTFPPTHTFSRRLDENKARYFSNTILFVDLLAVKEDVPPTDSLRRVLCRVLELRVPWGWRGASVVYRICRVGELGAGWVRLCVDEDNELGLAQASCFARTQSSFVLC